MKMIALKVDDDFYNNVKSQAKQTHRTVSQYVRDVLVTSQHPFISEKKDKNVDGWRVNE